MRFIYPSFLCILLLTVYFFRLDLYFAHKAPWSWVLHSIVLIFLASLYLSIISSKSNLIGIIKYCGLFLSTGALITVFLWPITYFQRAPLCPEVGSCSDNSVTYLSFSKDSALKKINNYPSEYFPLNENFIERGLIWPGTRSYYYYALSRDSNSDVFRIVNGHFDYDNFSEHSFTFSYFVAIFVILFRSIRGVYFRVKA